MMVDKGLMDRRLQPVKYSEDSFLCFSFLVVHALAGDLGCCRLLGGAISTELNAEIQSHLDCNLSFVRPDNFSLLVGGAAPTCAALVMGLYGQWCISYRSVGVCT